MTSGGCCVCHGICGDGAEKGRDCSVIENIGRRRSVVVMILESKEGR